MILFLITQLFAEPLEHPKINAHYFRPALDSRNFLSVNETDIGQCGSFLGNGAFSSASNPFLFKDDAGNETAMISSLDVLDLAGGFNFCNSRLGIHVPVIIRALGGLPSGQTFQESGIGDLLLDYKYRFSKPKAKIAHPASVA